MNLRQLLLKAGAQLLEPVVQWLVDQFDRAFEPSPKQRFVGRRRLGIQGLFGQMQISRDYYFDGEQGHCPADAGLEGGQGILDLRCALLSDRLDAFCAGRIASHAARNDTLKMAA